MVYVDAGDFTGDAGIPGQKQTDALIEAMRTLGYLVTNVSQREFLHGYDALMARRTRGDPMAFISANIVWQDSGIPVLDPTVVRKVTLRDDAKAREVRIGFIGLSKQNPAFLKEGPGGRRIVTADPLAAAEKYVPELKRKSDVVVALVSLDLDQARALPRKVKDVDLILGGIGAVQTRSDDFPEDTQFGKSHVFYIGDQGKNLGDVRLFFDEKKAITSAPRNLIGLTREWPDDAALAKLMQTTKEAVNVFNQEQATAGPFAGAPQAAGGAAVPGGAVAPETYTGSDRCAPCHENEFAIWARSKHARAFTTLVQAKQDYNPECVRCHSIGFGKERGFVNAAATPNLMNVGCESCHGPSSRHPEPTAKGFGRIDTTFCRTCHTSENSPDFDPATYIPKIQHWNEAKQAAR